MASERILFAHETALLNLNLPQDSYRAYFLSLDQKTFNSLIDQALAEFYEEGCLALSEA